MPKGGKHACKHCGKRFERANEHMTHMTLEHPEVTGFVPYAQRWKHRDFTCGQCYKLMRTSDHDETIKVCDDCGTKIDLNRRLLAGETYDD